MDDEIDWSVTTWEGNRLRQHREWLALSFREKVAELEAMEEVGLWLRGVRETPRDPNRGSPPDSPSE